MAKSKKIKLDIPEETILQTEKEFQIIESDSKEELKEVIGITEAEKLQKSGWQLIDCHLTPNGKLYKFKKG